jgi:hypothetical protein
LSSQSRSLKRNLISELLFLTTPISKKGGANKSYF